MTFIIKMFGVSIFAAFISAVLKKSNPALANLVLLASALTILLALISPIVVLINSIKEISNTAGIDNEYIYAMLQVTGCGIILKLLLAFLGDTGGESLKFAVEIGGRICLILIALPYIMQALNILGSLLQ